MSAPRFFVIFNQKNTLSILDLPKTELTRTDIETLDAINCREMLIKPEGPSTEDKDYFIHVDAKLLHEKLTKLSPKYNVTHNSEKMAPEKYSAIYNLKFIVLPRVEKMLNVFCE